MIFFLYIVIFLVFGICQVFNKVFIELMLILIIIFNSVIIIVNIDFVLLVLFQFMLVVLEYLLIEFFFLFKSVLICFINYMVFVVLKDIWLRCQEINENRLSDFRSYFS